ncbi:MAG: thermonuclease family protein [Deltaproteobacteria bacterium]|nr:thermonuclease family protein [Deltaproteobacteria bacterium]
MRRLIPVLLFLLTGCGGGGTSSSPRLEAPEPPRAVRVVDADTIDIDGIRYRLHGIDAPESYQTCRAWGQTWECGEAATQALLSHADNISCTGEASDRYGRVVGRCTARGVDVNAWLVREGWALAAYSTDYNDEEADARAQRRGIHRGVFVDPADRRRGQRLKGEDTIAGNFTPGTVDIPHLANGLLWGTVTVDGQLLDHSVFGITAAGDAVSFGDWQATDPDVTGSATWTGDMTAITHAGDERAAGSARLTVKDLGRPIMDLTLSSADASAFAALHWSDIPIHEGAFSASDGSMHGRFYGPQHPEASGVFYRDGWRGAFGVSR